MGVPTAIKYYGDSPPCERNPRLLSLGVGGGGVESKLIGWQLQQGSTQRDHGCHRCCGARLLMSER